MDGREEYSITNILPYQRDDFMIFIFMHFEVFMRLQSVRLYEKFILLT